MRVAGWLVLVPQLALADPPKEPTVTIRPPDSHDLRRVPDTTGDASGIVIVPPAGFPDARDYPYGMVIRPPDVHDDAIWISPGALDSSLHRFGLRFQDAVRELGKLFQTH